MLCFDHKSCLLCDLFENLLKRSCIIPCNFIIAQQNKSVHRWILRMLHSCLLSMLQCPYGPRKALPLNGPYRKQRLAILCRWMTDSSTILWPFEGLEEQAIQRNRQRERRRAQRDRDLKKRNSNRNVRTSCTRETPERWTRENENHMSSYQLAWTICKHLCLMQLSALEKYRKLRDGTIQWNIKCGEQAFAGTFESRSNQDCLFITVCLEIKQTLRTSPKNKLSTSEFNRIVMPNSVWIFMDVGIKNVICSF